MSTTSIFGDANENDVFRHVVSEGSVEPPGRSRRMFMMTSVQSVVGSTVVAASVFLFSDRTVAASNPEISPVVLTVAATSNSAEPMWRSRVAKRLSQFKSLPSGWEPSAPPISALALDALLAFLDMASSPRTPEPAIVPLIDGGVQAEWHTAGVDLEVSASPSGKLTAFVAGEGVDQFEEETISPTLALDGWLDDLLIS